MLASEAQFAKADNQEICAICRDENCDFETRCGHLFHEECLKAARTSTADQGNKCPYCRGEISSLKLLEKLVGARGDFSKISFDSIEIKDFKEFIKYGLTNESFPLDLFAQKMVEIGWDLNELDNWLPKEKRSSPHSLFYASYICGKLNLTHKLIKLGCKLERKRKDRKDSNESEVSKPEDNESAIPHAVKLGDILFIEKLIGLGADINVLDYETSALNVACEMDNVGMIDFLVENGANITGRDQYPVITLDLELIELDNEYKIINHPIITACWKESLNAIRRLHQHNPEIFNDDYISWSCFAVAIMDENLALVELLIELGGKLDSTGNACINSDEKARNRNLLMFACGFENLKIVKLVFDKGNFDVNATDNMGNTAILYSRKVETVKFLIEKGADPLVKTRNDNDTILHIACREHNYNLVKYLLNDTAFARMNLKNIQPTKMGLTECCVTEIGLILGIEENLFKILDLLLQKGADINEKNLNNETVFSHAHNFSPEIMNYLLTHGADVNSVDSNGINCLQRIIGKYSNLDDWETIIMLLIDHGINLNAQDKAGQTVLHSVKCNLTIFVYSLDSGARTDIPNNEGVYSFDLLLHHYPFGGAVKRMEKRGLNFSRDISNEVRAHPCDHCKSNFSSLKARCGHHLHVHCIKDENSCPQCGTKVSLSNKIEKMIEESNFKNLASLSDQELFIILDNYIEDEHTIDFRTITKEVTRRKNSRKDFSLKPSKLYIDLYAKACALSRLRLVKFFDSIGIYDNCPETKRAAILYASASGSIDMIEYLIQKFGPGIVNEPFESCYPIFAACMHNNLEIFEFLVKKGANLNVTFRLSKLLNFAAQCGSFDIVKRLIEKHGIAVCHCGDLFANILSDAKFFSMPLKGISKIIKLHEKSEDKIIEMIKYFLDRGASMNCREDYSKCSLVSLTGTYNREKLFDFLVDYSKNVLKKPLKLKKHKDIVIKIAECGKNVNFLKKVLKMGARANWADGLDCTPLMAACASSNYEMCSKLIGAGARVNDLDGLNEHSALQYLSERGNDDAKIAELLLRKGASTHCLINSESVLHTAAEFHHVNVAKKLLAYGADPNCRDEDFNTPLHLIFKHCFDGTEMLEVAKVLVKAGADINFKNEEGETPLSIAKNRIEFRKTLNFFNSLQKSMK